MCASRLVRWSLLALACVSAFLIRSEPASSRVFGEPGAVILQGNDAWAHSRTVEFLVHNFPHTMVFDPYSAWPNGQPSEIAPLFDFSVATVVLALGGGAPSEFLTGAVLAWAPVVFGALIPLPVFGLARRLTGSGEAGVAAAWIVAVMPGHFQIVSQLGFGDHHSLEGLLAASGMWALTAALQSNGPARGRWIAAAALIWAAYLAAWVAAALMIGILVFWAGLELLLAHLRGGRAAGVVPAMAAVLLFGWLSIQFTGTHAWSLITQAALPAGLIALFVLAGLFRLSKRLQAPVWAVPAAALVLAAAAVGGFAALAPEKFAFLWKKISLMAPDARFSTITELRPLLRFDGPWFWTPLWEQFRLAFPLALIGAFLLWRDGEARNRPAIRLALVWSCLILLLTLSQMRSSYYLAINLAVLSGVALHALAANLMPRRRTWALALLAAAANLPAVLAVDELNGPDPPILRDYRKVYGYLRSETPEPFGDAEAFFRYHPPPPAGEPFDYPPSAYGVMNWWDSGHTMTAIARRIPVSNPYQAGVDTAARFYLERDPAVAVEQLRKLGVRYALAGPELLMSSLGEITPADSKVDAMHAWIGADRDEMYGLARRADTGEPLLVFLPPYFQTMAARLSLYAGQGTEARQLTLLRLDRSQRPWLLMQDRAFESEASRDLFQAEHGDEGWEPGSLDPYRSPVSLEPVQGLQLVFKSQFRSLPAVKVYELAAR